MLDNEQIKSGVIMVNHMADHLDIFVCPACRGELKIHSDGITCLKCDKHYRVEDDIPLLFYPNEWDSPRKDVTDAIRSFYEKTPFPNYEELESVGDLIQKAQKGFFARLLNEQIPFNIRVLEVGCGTGQLSNFLGVAHRTVFSTDMCLNSLRLGQEFRIRNGLDSVGFYQMNLFRPIFKEETFPLVICNGVLHHTSDPFAGFESISRLVKKGGYIIIGLYNKYGRIITDIRRNVFKVFGNHFTSLDPILRGHDRGDIKKLAWFADQYKNPHESKHTIGEVLKWFDEAGFDFVYGMPNCKAFGGFTMRDSIFKTHRRGNWFDHFVVQSRMVYTGKKEGGFFIMIGRRKKQ
jgi:SAM-dependent methyltransferase